MFTGKANVPMRDVMVFFPLQNVPLYMGASVARFFLFFWKNVPRYMGASVARFPIHTCTG